MAVHTAVSALWGVGREARMLAFGLVILAWVYTAFWVGLGNGLNKNYESPTPVRYSERFTSFPHH